MSQIKFESKHRNNGKSVKKRFITLAAAVRLTRKSDAATFTVKDIIDQIAELEKDNPEMVNKDSTVKISITTRCCVNANNTGKSNGWKGDIRHPFYYWVNPGETPTNPNEKPKNDDPKRFRLHDPLSNFDIDPSW